MKRSHSLDVVVGLLLFCVFAVSMLAVLLTGAKAYKRISLSMDEQYRERTCISYIAAKIRHYNVAGAVEADTLEDTSVLRFTEEFDGSRYITYIYYYDGYICELFTPEDVELPLSEGMPIIAADALTFTEESDGLIRIACEAEGRSAELFISVLGKAGDAA